MVKQLAQEYLEKTGRDREKLECMMRYGQNASCRWRLLLEYFGEQPEWERCGHCDNCLHPIEHQIGFPIDSNRYEIEEMPTAEAATPEPHLEKGEMVTVPRYGEGRLEAIEDDILVISFPGTGVKKFKRAIVMGLIQKNAPAVSI